MKPPANEIAEAVTYLVKSVNTMNQKQSRERLRDLCSGLAVEFESATAWQGNVYQIMEAGMLAARLGFPNPPIVLDHHKQPDGIDIATAIVHPAQSGEIITVMIGVHALTADKLSGINHQASPNERAEIVRRLRRWSHDAMIAQHPFNAKLKATDDDIAAMVLAALHDATRGCIPSANNKPPAGLPSANNEPPAGPFRMQDIANKLGCGHNRRDVEPALKQLGGRLEQINRQSFYVHTAGMKPDIAALFNR